jgi:leader peptidase (prepilin peptidase)/N-methyltransferase
MILDLFVIAVGLAIGSFLSVCIYRVPLGRVSGVAEEGEDKREGNSEFFQERVTIAFPPRSFCTSCGSQLAWYCNIPVLSWLFLGGKSHCCKKRISWRYPLVEVLSALFAWLCFTYFGFSPTGILIYLFVCALIVLSFIDLDYFLLPNVITYPTIAVGIVVAVVNQLTHVFSFPIVPGVVASFWGFMAGAGFLYIVAYGYLWLRNKQGLGLGDVKLLAMTGIFFGPEASFYTIFIGSILGSIIGGTFMMVGRGHVSRYIPFGPYLAAANILYIFTDLWLMENIFSGIRFLVGMDS